MKDVKLQMTYLDAFSIIVHVAYMIRIAPIMSVVTHVHYKSVL